MISFDPMNNSSSTEEPNRDNVLLKAGWNKQFVASGARLQEAIEVYEASGFEVHLEAAQVGDLACPECAAPPSFGAPIQGWSVIYTRPRQISDEAPGRKEDLW
jgi:hypothetical protein